MSVPPPISPVVVAPTYNNATTVVQVLDGARRLGLPIIVINDGSTDNTPVVLEAWRSALPQPAVVTLLAHPRNRGKAAALRTGFEAAASAGHTHAVTLDTDGQLDPAQIPDLLAVARRHPDALVVGARDERQRDYPALSRLGRRASNLLVRLESGVRVRDSQCGLRVYPLALLRALRCRAGRYAFETEVITRAGWAGCPVLDVPVACRYAGLPGGRRVSHFRPLVDSLRAVALHARLMLRALLPWPRHARWPAQSQDAPRGPRPSLWRRGIEWCNPLRAWRQLRHEPAARAELAAGLAVGTFIANLPLYGLQTVAGLYAARRLHLHPASVVLGTQLSVPPLGPLLVAAGIATGHLLLHGSVPALADFDPTTRGIGPVLRSALLEWVLGGLLLGFVCAVATFVIAACLFKFVGARRPSELPALPAQ